MKIAVCGTIMRDEITTFRGERRESFGGILYNVLAVASLIGPSDRIAPVCFLSPEHRESILRDFLSALPQVDPVGLRPNAEGTDQNVLVYRSASDRDEVMTIVTPSMTIEDLADPLAGADALILNSVNGREFSLDLLRAIRQRYPGLHIHLDIHNLGKGLDPSGRLIPNSLENWRQWLEHMDTVQGNEWEMQLLLGKKPETADDCRQAALTLASVPALNAAVVTVGGKGSVLAHRMGGDGRLRTVHIPAMSLGDRCLDTTGCGDCYSSAFMVELLRSRNPSRAALFGTVLSGLNTTVAGLGLFQQRLDLESLARESFPELTSKLAQGHLGDPA